MIQVNLTAVVIASAAAMGVGFVWHSVFGEKMNISSMGKVFSSIFLATLVSAYILSIFIHYAGAYTAILGAKTGLWAWLGFVMPTTLANHLMSKKPLRLYLLQAGHYLIELMLMGAILAVMF